MLSLRRAGSQVLKRGYASVASTELSPFDLKWKSMSEAERDALFQQYDELQKGDWRKLTLEQKQQLYTIGYGPKEVNTGEGRKVFLGVLSLLGVSVVVFGLIRYFAHPPPKTMSKEHQEAMLERMKENNINPIFGISSKK